MSVTEVVDGELRRTRRPPARYAATVADVDADPFRLNVANGNVGPTDDAASLARPGPRIGWSLMTRPEFVALFPAGADTPIYGSREWEALVPNDTRRFASVVRAAECWRLEGTDEAIRDRLVAEIDFSNRFTAWRVRMLSNDLSAATDWSAISRWTPIGELQRLRRYGTEVA